MLDWHLECSKCGVTRGPDGLPTVCEACGKPWLVRYPLRKTSLTERDRPAGGRGMWPASITQCECKVGLPRRFSRPRGICGA